MKRTALAVGMCMIGMGLSACGAGNIPNTKVPDNAENRAVVDLVEKYRRGVEERNVGLLLKLASPRYFDDMGTPGGHDDVDYEKLREILTRMRDEVDTARYQISYRDIVRVRDEVLVEIMYTGWFRIETPEGPKWERRLEPHRLVLAEEDGELRIVSGM